MADVGKSRILLLTDRVVARWMPSTGLWKQAWGQGAELQGDTEKVAGHAAFGFNGWSGAWVRIRDLKLGKTVHRIGSLPRRRADGGATAFPGG